MTIPNETPFIPRDIVLQDCPRPLAGCFGDPLQDLAAALLLLAYQYHLKPWGYAFTFDQAAEAALDAESRFRWIRDMGVPNFTGLLDAGFVSSSGEMETRRYSFTEAGRQALRLWNLQ